MFVLYHAVDNKDGLQELYHERGPRRERTKEREREREKEREERRDKGENNDICVYWCMTCWISERKIDWQKENGDKQTESERHDGTSYQCKDKQDKPADRVRCRKVLAVLTCVGHSKSISNYGECESSRLKDLKIEQHQIEKAQSVIKT